MILALIGFGFILFGIIQAIRGVYRLFLALFYKRLATEKQVDRGYEKYITARSPEYKKFKKNVDREISELLK
tara:strand:+ start:400 stop:615 length:216 start_codon:yes stop_codon:yes gene_type:complete